MLTYKNINV